MDIEAISRTCHEANRAYCRSIGDLSHVGWDELSDILRESVYDGVRHALDNPGLSGEQSHQNWLQTKHSQGWVYGPVKDEALKTHPSLQPYHMLPVSERRKDFLFLAVINALRT